MKKYVYGFIATTLGLAFFISNPASATSVPTTCNADKNASVCFNVTNKTTGNYSVVFAPNTIDTTCNQYPDNGRMNSGKQHDLAEDIHPGNNESFRLYAPGCHHISDTVTISESDTHAHGCTIRFDCTLDSSTNNMACTFDKNGACTYTAPENGNSINIDYKQ